MVYLLCALDLRRLMGEALTDGECEAESAAFVHSLVRFKKEDKVESIVWIWELGLHRAG